MGIINICDAHRRLHRHTNFSEMASSNTQCCTCRIVDRALRLLQRQSLKGTNYILIRRNFLFRSFVGSSDYVHSTQEPKEVPAWLAVLSNGRRYQLRHVLVRAAHRQIERDAF